MIILAAEPLLIDGSGFLFVEKRDDLGAIFLKISFDISALQPCEILGVSNIANFLTDGTAGRAAIFGAGGTFAIFPFLENEDVAGVALEIVDTILERFLTAKNLVKIFFINFFMNFSHRVPFFLINAIMAEDLVMLESILFVADLERTVMMDEEGYTAAVAVVRDNADVILEDDDTTTLPFVNII